MKTSVATSLLKRLARNLAETSSGVRGKLLFQNPIEQVLCGLYLDDSGFDAAVFYPTVFVQPLYKKSDSLVFSLGRRLPGSWKADQPDVVEKLTECVKAEGLAVWRDMGDPEKLARVSVDSKNPHSLAAVGFSSVVSGDYERAAAQLRSALEALAALYPNGSEGVPSWPKELRSSIQNVLDLVHADPRSALAVLQDWRVHTLKAIRLSEFARPE